MRYCNNCGTAYGDGVTVCPRCHVGTLAQNMAQPQYVPVPAIAVMQPAQPQLPPQPQPLPQSKPLSQPQPPYTPGVTMTTTVGQGSQQPHGSGKEIVSVKGLYKKYSRKADWAVANVSFSCYAGEIVGLLGHNGAGKSTTLKCLEGMLPFDRGEIKIAGYDIRKQAERAKAHMGFVTDNHATFVKMTGLQYLNFMADVYNVPSKVRLKRLRELDEIFQLGKPIENLISSYSHGMRQKICMMGSLIHHPKLWILDEPMTGLDPRTMRAVQDFMHKYVEAGNSIIFSSHALNTVAKLCDRVVLIRKGKQVDELDVKQICANDPNFDFEEYFLRNEGQE